MHLVAPFGQRTNLEVDENDYLSRMQVEPDHAPYQFDYDATGLMVEQTDPRGSLHSYEYDTLGRVSRDEDPAGGGFTFSVVNSTRSVKVTRTSALGQVMTYDWRSNPDGSSRYTVTLPTGRSNVREIGLDGAATTRLVDGTTIRTQLQADAAFGMFAPVSTVTITAPNALIRTLTQTRAATVGSDGSTTMTESLNDTGRTTTRTFAPSTRTWNLTSAEGRTSRVAWDELGRAVSGEHAGTFPTTYRYDARGRVDRIAQGSDRLMDFVFDPASGYLLSSTDALAATTSFEIDSLGRITNVTGADQSQTMYEYDGESHLTAITPPDRPEHQLGYSRSTCSTTILLRQSARP